MEKEHVINLMDLGTEDLEAMDPEEDELVLDEPMEEELMVEDLPVPEGMKKEELIAEVYRLRKMGIAKDEKEKGLIIEVDYLRQELKESRRQIVEMKYSIEDLQEEYGREREVASNCVGVLKDFLFKWLTPDNQAFVKRMLRFYDDYNKARLIYAILKYLIFGEMSNFHKEVQKWHFNIICNKIDEDAVTLPAHSMMMKLMEKYGLFEKIDNEVLTNENVNDGNSESDSSEKEQAPGEGGC